MGARLGERSLLFGRVPEEGEAGISGLMRRGAGAKPESRDTTFRARA
jgi:hypothetical protein